MKPHIERSIPFRGCEFTVTHGEDTYTMLTASGVMPDQVDVFPDARHARLIYPPDADGRVRVVACRIDGKRLIAESGAMYRPAGNGEYVPEQERE